MPHMIISGMPGIGKTTSILCLARQLLGDAYKEAVLELNASDERGIDVVRNRIKGFAQKKVTLPPGRQKLVILDEADSMTSGAQQALRRTMEIYSATTRFAFACNQSNKIIEPLQSRCAILRYARLTDAQVVRRIMQVIEAEKVEYSDDGIAALVFSAEGDMRQAINNLQSTTAGFGFVNGDNVFKVVDSPHPIKVQVMIKACHETRIDDAMVSLKELWDLGYSCHDIISTMFRVTKTIDTLSEHAKLEFIKVRLHSIVYLYPLTNIIVRKSASRTCVFSRASRHCSNSPAASLASARSTCSHSCSFCHPSRNSIYIPSAFSMAFGVASQRYSSIEQDGLSKPSGVQFSLLAARTKFSRIAIRSLSLMIMSTHILLLFLSLSLSRVCTASSAAHHKYSSSNSPSQDFLSSISTSPPSPARLPSSSLSVEASPFRLSKSSLSVSTSSPFTTGSGSGATNLLPPP
jgi:replication factor C subunit 2/4